ncbi:mutS protein homolog 5 isoform X1 [Oryzias latipes]|uniref:MutS protein homolog 5 n=1 Tax=Oryzias latipes TaxID=8090 RepID=H2LZA0_ORYLA|nr:mutS protein homolog 5 isoform X1 [Oryzias latipes]XP_020565849.1 mutS protein homolog 5 isoform X1 [Oryzias latipes]XP_020565850.1 mutS protein homolog 5 isoform X1 [Oryzias latipes]XP_020565851.1 mutS protein homolog 5 isoform X1 [Oryzias latipes]XP_020565852.1 mutS protein homolog 5 isoform X1 [Oryzias latipes]
MAGSLGELGGRGVVLGAPGLNEEDEEEEESSLVLLSVLVQHGQVGLCFYDSGDSSLHYMVDTPDNYDLHLLARVIREISPHVIITSAKMEHCMTRFLQHLASIPHYKPEVVTYPYVDFGLEVGKQRLLSAHLPLLPASITERDRMSYLSSCITFDSPLMLRAVGALLKCLDRRRVGVELEDSSVGVPILQFHAYTLKGGVYIDSDTYSVLQIFKSDMHPSVYKLHSGEKEGLSLYGIMNRCRCKFGAKLLRQWFLRPTQDLAVLCRRQEVIRFFTSPQNSDVLSTLQSLLRNIRNIPSLLRRMSLANTKVTDWQSLYKTVYSVVCVRDSVRHLPQSIGVFRDISGGFSDDLSYITALIGRIVDFEATVQENRFTVKPNVDPAIDEKKRRMAGLSDFLTDVARRELEHLDPRVPSCCVIYIPLIGFLLSLPRLPSMVEKEDFEMEGLEFMFLSEDRLHYRSQRTRELDELLGDMHCDIRDMETAVMTQLQNAILERSPSLYQVLDLIAELDCLMAMSSASQEYSYTSPKLASHKKITITQGRHPLLELCSPVFVANSFQSFDKEGRVKIITGPNSSGKSIYLKQVGLIVFMALIGSDVPAKEAEIGLVDGIYTRMQSRESVSVGLSTFMIDLNQMAQALNSSTGNSLLLIDEFGKGTNSVDGLSLLAASVCHWLRKAPVDVPHILLSTNFHSLLQLGLLPASRMVSFLTLETAVDGDELVFLYQLREGICQSSYAANIASLAGLPARLVHRAVEVSEHYRTGKPIKRTQGASSDEKEKRCKIMVEKFLSLDLDNKDLDLKSFMKEEILPSAGEPQNSS